MTDTETTSSAETTPPADPPSGTTPPAAGDTGDTGGTATPWHQQLTLDDDLRGTFDGKGFAKFGSAEEAFAGALKSLKGAEQKMRAPAERVLVLPEDGATPEFWTENAARLGVPENVEGYDFERPSLPEGQAYDRELESTVLSAMHKAGAPKHVAEAAVSSAIAYAGKLYEADAKALKDANEKTTAELRAQWGPEFETRRSEATRAVEEFAGRAGLSQEASAAMVARMAEDAGDASVIRLFAEIGRAMGEDSYVSGEGGGDNGPLSAEEAIRQANELARSKEYQQARHRGGADYEAMKKRREDILKRGSTKKPA